jgi:Flp pilus assembly protein TadD
MGWPDMNRTSSSARNAGFTLCSAMVAALLGGCAGQPPIAGAGGAPVTQASSAEAGGAPMDKLLAKAEARVARAPANASARAELAQTYFAAGRFASAATTFEDAIALGDESPRNGLSLALSYVGSGRSAEAIEVLRRWHDRIPAGDVGLALALAGEPGRAVALLTDTLRGGENNAKVRQNLAYAYALDGRWSQARVVASQDVPADELDNRIAEWAAQARPGQTQVRVAALLGTPLRSDTGQPASLALGGAREGTATAVAIAQATPPVTAVAEELPALENGRAFGEAATTVMAASAEIKAPVEIERPAAAHVPAPTSGGTTLERAFAGVAPLKAGPARAAPVRVPAASGRHLVQLGSFTTMAGAQRAWGIYLRNDPRLKGHTMRITEAQVNGRRYFRVAAEGFDRGSAQGLCSAIQGRGESCLAYADTRAKPGDRAAPMLARSR